MEFLKDFKDKYQDKENENEQQKKMKKNKEGKQLIATRGTFSQAFTASEYLWRLATMDKNCVAPQNL